MNNNIQDGQRVALDWDYVPVIHTETTLKPYQKASNSGAIQALLNRHNELTLTQFLAEPLWLNTTDAEFFITSDAVFKRFFTHGIFTRKKPSSVSPMHDEFEIKKQFYEALFSSSNWTEVAEFDTGNGPRTLVFKNLNIR